MNNPLTAHMEQDDRSVLKLEIESVWASIPVQDKAMPTYICTPKGEGGWPAVVLLMEIFGVNLHIQQLAQRLASEGYVVFAPNYFYRTADNLQLGYSDEEVLAGREHKNAVKKPDLLQDIQSLISYIASQKHVLTPNQLGCIGFCFGGHVALIASHFPEFKVIASFYPGGVCGVFPDGSEPTLNSLQSFDAELLCFFGLNDSLIPLEDIDLLNAKLRALQVNYDIIRYNNTGHGFFCDAREGYDSSAAEDAWARLKLSLAQNLRVKEQLQA